MKKSPFSDLLKNIDSRRHPMDKAVERKDLEFVKNNLSTTDDTVLYHAVRKGATDIFEYAFPLFPVVSQKKALNAIAAQGRMDYLDFALGYLGSSDLSGESGPYDQACRCGNFEMLQRLEALGMQKSAHSFFYALDSNNIELINHVYSGEDIGNYFNNPHSAMTLPVLKFVMSHTVLSERVREKILLTAASSGLIDVIQYLLSEPNPPSSQGALFETTYMGNQLPTMQYLLTKAPILSNVCEDDYHAFTWAYDKGYKNIVSYLVNNHGVGPESHRSVLAALEKDNFELYHKTLKTKSCKKISL